MAYPFRSLLLAFTGAVIWHDAGAFDPDQRLAFVTSVTSTGNLSTWTDAGGQTGLAAADAICQARATAAGLPQPNQFVAWLSDDTDDAYCRIYGLAGKRSANCGQASLPAAAGPWWRTDGQVFADDITDALNNRHIFRVLDIDEFGQLSTAAKAFTQTGSNGARFAAFGTCQNWTSGAANQSTLGGLLTATSAAWSEGFGTSCNTPAPLYCLQKGVAAAPLPGHSHRGRPAFASSNNYTGNFGSYPQAQGAQGAAAADMLCRADATSLGMPRPETFRAWISDTAFAAASRFQNDGPWYRSDGVRVASGLAQLQSSGPEAPINLTPGANLGTYHASLGVWTGTLSDGTPAGANCAAWTSSDSGVQAIAGTVNHIDSAWLESGSALGCSSSLLLYCLADNDTLYAHGFE